MKNIKDFNLTKNEKAILKTLEDNRDWLPSADAQDLAGFNHIDLTVNQVKGVLGSLTKKELVDGYQVNGNGAFVHHATGYGERYYNEYLKESDEDKIEQLFADAVKADGADGLNEILDALAEAIYEAGVEGSVRASYEKAREYMTAKMKEFINK